MVCIHVFTSYLWWNTNTELLKTTWTFVLPQLLKWEQNERTEGDHGDLKVFWTVREEVKERKMLESGGQKRRFAAFRPLPPFFEEKEEVLWELLRLRLNERAVPWEVCLAGERLGNATTSSPGNSNAEAWPDWRGGWQHATPRRSILMTPSSKRRSGIFWHGNSQPTFERRGGKQKSGERGRKGSWSARFSLSEP